MSFFGFDSKIPEDGYDFEDTYDGLGEKLNETDDAFNDETFGNVTVGKDFDFGHPQSSSAVTSNISYAQAAVQPRNDIIQDDILKPMENLWSNNTTSQPTPAPAPQQQQQHPKNVLSLEEIESQFIANSRQQQQQQQQQHAQFPPQFNPMFGVPPPPGNFGYMIPPGANPHQFPPGFIPPMQNLPQNSGQMPFLPQGFPPGQQPPQLNLPPQQAHHHQQPIHTPQQQNIPVQQVTQHQQISPSKILQNKGHAKPDLSQFPVLGSKQPLTKEPIIQQHQPQQQQSFQQPHQHHAPAEVFHHNNGNNTNHHHHNNNHGHSHSNSHQFNQFQQQRYHEQELTPEEQDRLVKRSNKVQRIMKYSGIMNPRDKDFVTRFQLSQIVTEDPYNEDFYFQVHKAIKAQNNQPLNSIAQAYLEQSGHRLGGRYKRADVALQRMQQQVQKAVTVAKERPKLTQLAREGALGKITFGNGKKPRQQLDIVKRERETEVFNNIASGLGVTSSKKFLLYSLEKAISNVLTLEGAEREGKPLDPSELWDSLHVLDQTNTINPFIQMLSYDKGLKLFPRIFHFLGREQRLTIVTLIMANLQHLQVISKGSYKSYPDSKIPDNIAAKIDLFQLTALKVLVIFLSEAKFNEIIGLLIISTNKNNVSFISTTKIGLSLITILISRAELIKQEFKISATDLSSWSSCYDELFTSLESKLSLMFPPGNANSKEDNDSYIWQFLASLALSGKLNHQRIIVDEIRDEIFGTMTKAKTISGEEGKRIIGNLNLFLNVMGLNATETEITELK